MISGPGMTQADHRSNLIESHDGHDPMPSAIIEIQKAVLCVANALALLVEDEFDPGFVIENLSHGLEGSPDQRTIHALALATKWLVGDMQALGVAPAPWWWKC